MMQVPVTSLYAALLALLFVLLSGRVIRGRRASRLSLGVAGDPALERLVRVHGNFAEYVPLALLLLLLEELDGGPRWISFVSPASPSWPAAPRMRSARRGRAGISVCVFSVWPRR